MVVELPLTNDASLSAPIIQAEIMSTTCWSSLRDATLLIVSFAMVAFVAAGQALATPASDFNAELQRYQQLEREGRYLDAVRSMERMLQIAETSLSDQPELIGNCLNNLGAINQSLGRFDDSEKYYKRALPLYQRLFGANSQYAIDVVSNLAILYTDMGRFDEAESHSLRAIAAQEKLGKRNDPNLANYLNTLGVLYHNQGRSDESEATYRRVLAIRERILRPDDPALAMSYGNLAATLHDQGQFAQAEPLMKRSLSIYEKSYGPEHPDIATALNNLANLYTDQGRYAEAEKLHRRTLAIREKALGPEHASVAISLYNLANTLNDDQEAESLVQRAFEFKQKSLGPEHPDVAYALNALAIRRDNLGDFEKAEELHKQALQIREKSLGANHPDVMVSLSNLALLYEEQQQYDKALPLVERSLKILEKQAFPDRKLKVLQLRARLAWQAGDKDDAVRDVAAAIALAEDLRGSASGYEMDAARHFSKFSSAFEQMIAYQLTLRNVDEAFRTAEQARSRALVDQMQLHGTDLLAGLPKAEASVFRQRESAAKQQLASLEKQRSVLAANEELTDEDFHHRRTALKEKIDRAKRTLVDIQREIYMASPAYRMTVTESFSPVESAKLQAWLAQEKAMALQYVVGADEVYLFAITGEGVIRAYTLQVSDALAKQLGIEPGTLTSRKLQTAIDPNEGYLFDLLNDPARNSGAIKLLASLWLLLMPEEIQAELVSGEFRRVYIIPDGPLALLPFDTLIVKPGDDPIYLLDVGPPPVSAPSATIVYNLATRAPVALTGKRKPVLTVGDPAYPQATPKPGASVLEVLMARSRYSTVGGKLQRLPYSGTESDWVKQVYSKHGIAVGQLKRQSATEAQVRFNVLDRRIVHLACHGVVDQEYGNLFGALALTPGAADSLADDDGFLTLPEIYALDLKTCELAILSACDTNYGPQQKSEGVWALSRGFLVAGARRVVASNWLVDDEAAASLISYFASGIAADEAKGEPVDYAARLKAAKRWVRQQEKWGKPYYWGAFVLLGPN